MGRNGFYNPKPICYSVIKIIMKSMCEDQFLKLLLFSMPCQVINSCYISFAELLSPRPGQWLCFLGMGSQLLKAANVWIKWSAQAISFLLISSFATSWAAALNQDLLTSSWTNTSRSTEHATQTHLSSFSSPCMLVSSTVM